MTASTMWIGLQATKAQLAVSDTFIGVYNYSDEGVPSVAIEHTNIIKAPLLWLQGQLPYTPTNVAVFNVGYILISFFLWIFLLRKVFGSRIVAPAALLFSAIIINSTAFAINITQTTIRHIEYPIALLFILGVYKFIHKTRNYFLLGLCLTIFLAILILHDRFFLYTTVPAIAAVAIWSYFRGYITTKLAVLSFVMIVAGLSLSVLIAEALTFFEIINISHGYIDINSLISLSALPDALLLSVEQTLNMFGANIFGLPLKPLYSGIFACFSILVLFFVYVYANKKNLFQKKQSVRYFITVSLLLTVLFCYLSYILTGMVNPTNSRLLTIVVYIGVALGGVLIVDVSRKSAGIYSLICIILVIVSLIGVPQTTQSYDNSKNIEAGKRNQMQKISDTIREEGATVLASNGGYQPVRFYSNGAIEAVPELLGCVSSVWWVNNNSWITPGYGVFRTAFLIDENYKSDQACSSTELKDIYGEPSKEITLDSDTFAIGGKVNIYIFDYDIRTRFIVR
jgi:drug/metabolite transporter (DMT)-like permease